MKNGRGLQNRLRGKSQSVFSFSRPVGNRQFQPFIGQPLPGCGMEKFFKIPVKVGKASAGQVAQPGFPGIHFSYQNRESVKTRQPLSFSENTNYSFLREKREQFCGHIKRYKCPPIIA